MHPELLNNAHFLRYYHQWQKDPASIVFAPIAEYLIGYKLFEEAILVCKEGLKNNPDFLIGRLVLAKAYYRMKDFGKAEQELSGVLREAPDLPKAVELMQLIEASREPAAAPVSKPPEPTPQKERAGWETVTMARIYAAQGHREKAIGVYRAILEREPSNEEARRGLKQLSGES